MCHHEKITLQEGFKRYKNPDYFITKIADNLHQSKMFDALIRALNILDVIKRPVDLDFLLKTLATYEEDNDVFGNRH